MCYYISVVCGCSSMARIPAFQAGRVGSIPITRSKRKVAVKRLFCFLKIRESNLRFALLRFPLLPRCRLQLPTAALRFARCIIRRMRSQPHPSPDHTECCYSSREVNCNNTLFFYFVSLMLLHLQLFLFVIIICRQLRKNVMKNALFVCLYPYFNFCTER